MTGALAFNNQHVQRLRRLIGRRSARHDEQRVVVEGGVLVAEAVEAGWIPERQFVRAGSAGAVAGAGPVAELAEGVFERVAATETPQEPIAIFSLPDHEPDAVLRDASFVVALDRVQDPGNLGTIIRSAEAAGVDAVVVTPGSVDAYAPKTVRASAGAVFHVPVVVASLDALASAGLRLIGTSSHDAPGRSVTDHDRTDWSGRLAIVLGNEAAGLDDDAAIENWVTIRHRGRAESLNVAMSATVLVFEAARHRT